MKKTIRAALAAALLGTTAIAMITPVTAQQQQAPQPMRVSPDVAKKLNAANALIGEKKLDEAQALVNEAKALPKLTPADEYQLNKFTGIIAVQKDDYATAEKAFDFIARSPVLPEADKASTLLTTAGLAAANKNYDRVFEYVAMAEAANIRDPNMYAAAAQAANAKDDFKTGESYANKAIEASKAAGKLPPRSAYDVLLQSQLGAKNDAAAQTTMEALAFNYGTAEDWGYAISQAIGTPGATDVTVIYLGRLVQAAKAKTVSQDYKLFGEAAFRAGYLGDAVAAQDAGAEGLAANLRAKATSDKAAVVKAEAEANKSPNGIVAQSLAQAYYGYGDYAKAEAMARLAISKGGLKEPNDAQMVLAQSLVAQGHYSDALPILAGIKSTNASMNKAVYLWNGYAQQKLKQVSAPPAAPAQ